MTESSNRSICRSINSSNDSSNCSNINIRRVEPLFQSGNEIYPQTSQYSDDESVSTLSEEYISNIPHAVLVHHIEANYDSDNSDDSSILSLSNLYEGKVFLYKYIRLIIWGSYIIGLILMPKVNFKIISPDNTKLMFQTISSYPQCSNMRGQLWRFFSNSIVHANFQHVFLNTFILFPLLYLMEILQGYKNLIYIFFLSSIYTGLIYTYFNPYNKMIGCSHIIFAFSGSILSNLFINGRYIDYYLRNILLIVSISVILTEFISYYFFYQKDIAYIAHWAGWISGFFFGLMILKDRQKNKLNRIALMISSNVISVLTVYFLYYYITDWPPTTDNILASNDLPYCCYEMLINNNTNIPCYK